MIGNGPRCESLGRIYMRTIVMRNRNGDGFPFLIVVSFQPHGILGTPYGGIAAGDGWVFGGAQTP